jgi:hypothetical protein
MSNAVNDIQLTLKDDGRLSQAASFRRGASGLFAWQCI